VVDCYEFFTRDGSKMRRQLSTVASSPFERGPIPDCCPSGAGDGDLDLDRQCRCCRLDAFGAASVADEDDDDRGRCHDEYRDNGDDFCSVYPVRAEITRPVLEAIILMVTRRYGMDRHRLCGDAICLRVESIIREMMQLAVRRHVDLRRLRLRARRVCTQRVELKPNKLVERWWPTDDGDRESDSVAAGENPPR
jgi:hypothetical protein